MKFWWKCSAFGDVEKLSFFWGIHFEFFFFKKKIFFCFMPFMCYNGWDSIFDIMMLYSQKWVREWYNCMSVPRLCGKSFNILLSPWKIFFSTYRFAYLVEILQFFYSFWSLKSIKILLYIIIIKSSLNLQLIVIWDQFSFRPKTTVLCSLSTTLSASTMLTTRRMLCEHGSHSNLCTSSDYYYTGKWYIFILEHVQLI